MMTTMDVPGAIGQFEEYSRMIQSVTTPYYQMADAVAFEHRNPIGLVGLISPWNVPAVLFCQKLSVAIVCDRDDNDQIANLGIVVGALGPRPKAIKKLDKVDVQAMPPTIESMDKAVLVPRGQAMSMFVPETWTECLTEFWYGDCFAQ